MARPPPSNLFAIALQRRLRCPRARSWGSLREPSAVPSTFGPRQPGRRRPSAPERPVVLVAAPPDVQRLVQASLRDAGFRVDAMTRRQLTTSPAVDIEPDVVVIDAGSV